MQTIINKTKTTEKKINCLRKSRFSKWKEWWASLSEEKQTEYKDNKDTEKKLLLENYIETNKKVEKLYENISKMNRDDLFLLFKDMTSFHDYSVMNNLFIKAQNNDATTVWGRNKWFSYWYKLKENAKPIFICAPVEKVVFSKDIYKRDYEKFKEDPRNIEVYRKRNNILFKFKLDNITESENGDYKLIIRKKTAEFNNKAKIYDITDVEPIIKDWVNYSKPLNDFTIKSNIDYFRLKNRVVESFWFIVEEKPIKVSTWWFVIVWNNKNITINSNLDDTQKSWALIHECAHLLLWHTDENHNKAEKGSSLYKINYAIDEIQAETLAYLFREQLWIESKSERYIKWYLEFNEIWDDILLRQLKSAIKIFDINKNKFNNI